MLARAFLLDAIATAVRVPDSRTVIAYRPPESHSDLEDILYLFRNEEEDEKVARRAGKIELMAQSGNDAGERIGNLAECLFSRGAKRIIFVCSDNPLMEPMILKISLELLKRHQVVIGPTFDGAYYLLGFSDGCPPLFREIDWNASNLYRRMVGELDARGVNWQELELSYDIDRPEELRQLYFDIDNLRLAGKDRICCHTEKCLANLRI